MDSGTDIRGKFVDNRVDPPKRGSVSFGLPEGASGTRTSEITSRKLGTQDGRFGRFIARPRRGPFGET